MTSTYYVWSIEGSYPIITRTAERHEAWLQIINSRICTSDAHWDCLDRIGAWESSVRMDGCVLVEQDPVEGLRIYPAVNVDHVSAKSATIVERAAAKVRERINLQPY